MIRFMQNNPAAGRDCGKTCEARTIADILRWGIPLQPLLKPANWIIF